MIAFQIHPKDNVATALAPITPGTVTLRGDAPTGSITAITDIPQGHKIALCDIPSGTYILKYGVTIGQATQDIPAGSWVHLHNIHSTYDERSSHLDPITGAPLDTQY